MKSVWFVEEGEYSDYRVKAVFETEAQALEFSSHRPEDSSIRKVELAAWTTEQSNFTFTFDLGGNITKVIELADLEQPSDIVCSHRFAEDAIQITVQRGPLDLAKKIASERYVKIRAFLAEADERMERADYQKNGNYRFNDALRVAEVLAGLTPMPDPPRCEKDREILLILGVAA